jgi:hypothetical protein
MKKIRKDGWDIGFYECGPNDAKVALTAMTEDQRTSSEASIRNLVREIEETRFGMSNDAWVRTVSGVFLNGKHRAEAIVRSGKTVEIILMTVPDKDASIILRIMDCGVTRSVAHVAQMLAHVKNSSIAASIAKMVLAYDKGLMTCQGCYASTNRTAQDKYVSRDDILDYIKAHVGQLETSSALSKSLSSEYGLLGTTGPAFVHYLVSRRHSAKVADEFLSVLFSGKGERSDSVEPLRKALCKDLRSIRKVSCHVKTASIMKTFKSWCAGTVPPRGFVGVGETLPTI